MKSHLNPFNPDSYFSSFTLLYFLSQVVTQMHWAVSCTYGFMYQLMFFLSLISIFPSIYFPTNITYVTMSFTLPNKFCYWNCTDWFISDTLVTRTLSTIKSFQYNDANVLLWMKYASFNVWVIYLDFHRIYVFIISTLHCHILST